MLRRVLSSLVQRTRCNAILSTQTRIGTTSYISPSLLSSCVYPSFSSITLSTIRSFASEGSSGSGGASSGLVVPRPRGPVRHRTPRTGGTRKGGTSTGRVGGRSHDKGRGRASSVSIHGGGRALDSRAQREMVQKRKALSAKEARLQRTAPYRQRDLRSGGSSSSTQQHRPPTMPIAAPESLSSAVTQVDHITGQATEVMGVSLDQLGKPSALEVLAPHARRTRQQRGLLSPEEYNDLRNRPVRPIRHVPLPQVPGEDHAIDIDTSDAGPVAPGQVKQGDNSIMHRLTQQYGKEKATWMARKIALKRKGITQWRPRNKISRPEMNMLRQLFEQNSEKYSVPVLAERFSISGEAVRRILKSKWQPGAQRADEMTSRHDAEKMIKKMVRQEGFKLRRHPKPGESIEEFHETRKLAFEQLEAQIRASTALAGAKENQFRKYTKTGNKASLHGERPGRGGGGVTKWWGTVDDLIPHKRDGHFHKDKGWIWGQESSYMREHQAATRANKIARGRRIITGKSYGQNTGDKREIHLADLTDAQRKRIQAFIDFQRVQDMARPHPVAKAMLEHGWDGLVPGFDRPRKQSKYWKKLRETKKKDRALHQRNRELIHQGRQDLQRLQGAGAGSATRTGLSKSGMDHGKEEHTEYLQDVVRVVEGKVKQLGLSTTPNSE